MEDLSNINEMIMDCENMYTLGGCDVQWMVEARHSLFSKIRGVVYMVSREQLQSLFVLFTVVECLVTVGKCIATNGIAQHHYFPN